MTSADLLLFSQKDLRLETQWWVSGKHYEKTCEVCIRFHNECTIAKIIQDWLSKMDVSKKEIWPQLIETYVERDTATWCYRWQIVYMACAELFAYEGGGTWGDTLSVRKAWSSVVA